MTRPQDAATEALAEAEHIVGVALSWPSGLHVVLPKPARHHHVLRLIYEAGLPDPGPDGQGFLTNKGRFVDRELGLAIASFAGQIAKKHGNPDMLFSEDLW